MVAKFEQWAGAEATDRRLAMNRSPTPRPREPIWRWASSGNLLNWRGSSGIGTAARRDPGAQRCDYRTCKDTGADGRDLPGNACCVHVCQGRPELGCGGVRQALGWMRCCCRGGPAALLHDDAQFGAFLQQPVAPEAHSKSQGAGRFHVHGSRAKRLLRVPTPVWISPQG